MTIKHICIYTSLCLLFSCSEGLRKKKNLVLRDHHPFMINMQNYFSEDEMNMSFPIWFNDSIIRESKIKSLERSVYLSSTSKDTFDLVPKEVIYYYFNEEGEVESIKFNHFYDNVKVGEFVFHYPNSKDENGFALVEKVVEDENEANDQFDTYTSEKIGDRFLAYRNEVSGDYLFYMLDKKNWGALSIDSILKPAPNDVVFLGPPKSPSKHYHVNNTVNQSHVVDYKYGIKSKTPLEIEFDAYPFHYKRTITYDSSGFCQGFVDSTFSDKKYLTRRVSKFNLIGNIPVLLTHEKKSKAPNQSYFQIEKFEYEYYK